MSNYFINFYGTESQYRQLAKECIELAHAINDYLDDKDSEDHVKEEMGDVSNIVKQFEEHYNDGSILSWCHKKQDRQLKRIRQFKLILAIILATNPI